MDYQIGFPNLGLFFSHVGKTIDIGSFSIAYYGICVTLGMCLGILILCLFAKEKGYNPDDFIDLSVIALFFGVIGARIYYVAFSWDAYKNDLLSVFNTREGGLAIYGGIIGGVLAVYVITRIRKLPFFEVADICILGLPVGQMIGRWGNFFNREAFGGYTDGLFAMQLPVSAVRSGEITSTMWEHVTDINGIQFISVHPTFLYESLWNLGVFLFLLFMRKRTHFKGELFLLYAAGYGVGRFFIEQLRTDQLLIPGTTIPVSMVLSLIVVVIAAALAAAGEVKFKKSK